jgi:putative endopeptidase
MKKILSIILLSATIIACKNTKKETAEIVSEVTKENSSNNPSTKLSTVDMSYLSKTIKPQDDFFMFSNEEWIKANPVPPSESRWGSFNELDQNNKEKLTSILKEAASSNSAKGSDNQILGDYFSSYMNMESREKLGSIALKKELDKIQSVNSKEELVGIIANNHIHGISGFFSFGVGQDLKNVDNNISYLSQGGISLPNKEYYLDTKKATILASYQKYVSELFVMAGLKAEKAKEAQISVLTIESKLAGAMYTPAEMRLPEKTYNKKSLEDVKILFGKFDFEKYLVAIGSQTFDSLVVGNPEFITGVSKMIEQANLSDLKNYLSWHVLNSYSGDMGMAFVEKRFDFYGKVLSGKTEMKPLHENAIDEITNLEFGELLGKAFVEKYFSQKAQNRVNEMVDNLLIVFRERINGLDWMTQETKAEALNKLNSIGRKLGFPSYWEDYSSLAFTSDNYIENVKEINRFSHYKNLKELNQPVDKEKWGMPAHMVNAYYHPLLNEIAFPAGIMQAPFFDENAEDAVNYGRIGMVIGHEFTHGFDDMGSKFAADGSFKNWWSESDRKLFEEKTTILGETFSSFCPIEGHCVNPDLTMGENIADLGGLTLAYYAYLKTAEYKVNEIRESFTPSQRFFIAYAQLWKINYTEEEMKNRIANDPHSPGMYRVNGPLKNCPEFFEAFNVKEGDKMRNPDKKIAKIW